MPRRKGMNGSFSKVRSDLEAVLGALADHGECSPRVEIRIRQAMRRAGLGSLLDPALDDLARMVKDVDDAKSQLASALQRLAK